MNPLWLQSVREQKEAYAADFKRRLGKVRREYMLAGFLLGYAVGTVVQSLIHLFLKAR